MELTGSFLDKEFAEHCTTFANAIGNSAVNLPQKEIPPLETLLKTFDEVWAEIKPRELSPPPLRTRKIGKYVYLPLKEPRDGFEERLLLAEALKTKGFEVLLGSGADIGRHRLSDLPPGIALFSGLSADDAKSFYQVANAGHYVCVLPEYLLWAPHTRESVLARTCEAAFQVADFVYAPTPSLGSLLKSITDPAKIVSLDGYTKPAETKQASPAVVYSNAALINHKAGYRNALKEAFLYSGPSNRCLDEVKSSLRQQVIDERTWHDSIKPADIVWLDPREATDPYQSKGIMLSLATTIARVRKDSSSITAPDYCKRVTQNAEGLADQIASHMETVWRKNQYPMPFQIKKAWSKRPTIEGMGADTAFVSFSSDYISSVIKNPPNRLGVAVWAFG